jgi:hypothetical protein
MVQQTALTALRHEEARLSYRIGVKKDLSSVGVFKPRVIHVGRDDFRIGAFPDFSCIRHRPPLSLSLSLSFKTSFASMMGERARALFGARLKSNPLAISLSSSPRPPASRDTRNAYRFIVMSNHPPFHREGGGDDLVLARGDQFTRQNTIPPPFYFFPLFPSFLSLPSRGYFPRSIGAATR